MFEFSGYAVWSILPTANSKTPTEENPPIVSSLSIRESVRYFGQQPVIVMVVVGLVCFQAGCGNTKSYIATDQLLMSDAVDATVSKLDFSPLRGQNVYLDATYIKTAKSPLLIDSDYVISSLRQQLVGAGVKLCDSRDEADLVAEARLGALGLDGHNVSYGIPASSAISTATGIFANAPPVPTIPEISFARREAKSGAAKIAVFAYDRMTREPVWQSGIASSKSDARDTWVLGAGPWQRGTIYEGTHFAGKKFFGRTKKRDVKSPTVRFTDSYARFTESRIYRDLQAEAKEAAEAEPEVATASAVAEAKPANETSENSE